MSSNQYNETDVKKFTWKEIKQMIESAGVSDDDEIDGINISWGACADFECQKDEVFGWQIYL